MKHYSRLAYIFWLIIYTISMTFLGNAFAQAQIALDYSTPIEYTIGGVSVSGVEYHDKNALISIAGFQVGEKIKIPGDDISKAIKKLWKLGIVGDVQIAITSVEGDKVFLEIILTERPRLSRYYYEGVPKGQMTTLDDKVKLLRGRIVTDAMIKNARNTIRRHYAEKGFRNTEVTITKQKDEVLSNSVVLRIKIDKNKKVKVDEIAISGNEEVSDKKLKKKMKKTKEKRFGRIFKSAKFINDEYETDKSNIVTFYNSQGYRNAEILADSVTDINRKRVKVGIDLLEGQKYYYRNITWKGNYKYDDSTLDQVLGIERGNVYNPEELNKRLNFNPNGTDITSLYMDDGYLFFSIKPVEVLVENDSIDIEMRIYEGEQATINKVIVNGNTKTNDHVIMREIRTIPGQKFSRSDLLRTQRELATLGYFDPEQIGINPKPNFNDGTVDIEYSVVEQPSDQIELSGGWGGQFGFVGTLGLTFNNFSLRKITDFKSYKPLPFGDGQRLSLRMQANGRRFQTYSLSFTEPWLGGRKPNSFSVNLSHSIQRRFDGFGDQIGNMKVNGIGISLGRRLTVPDDFFTMVNSLNFQSYNLTNFAAFSNEFTDGLSYNIGLTTTFARNSIDSPTFPRRGSQVSLAVTLTPPYSIISNRDFTDETNAQERFRWVEYHKWMFDNSWFLEIANKLVLNTRTHFGILKAYNDDKGVGPFERFQLGGDGMAQRGFLLGTDIIGLRGYENNSIVPNNPLNRDDQQGGTVFSKYVLELRYALSLNPSATIWIHTFAEGGNNWATLQEFDPFTMNRSAGVGARIFMPAFGLLGIDWAYGYDDVTNSVGVNQGGAQFHFTIGQQIR